MAIIDSSSELRDNFSAVLTGITNSVNATLSVINDLNQSMNAPIDTASLQAAQESINQAAIAAEQLGEAMRDVGNTPTWQTDTSIEVFNTSGMERYRQEIGSVNEMMNSLRAVQEQITQNAVYGNVLPPQAANDMIRLNERISAIGQRIQEISLRPIDAVTPQELNQLEQLRNQLNTALQLQGQINTAVSTMDIGRANQAYLRLSQTVGNTEQHIRDNISGQEQFNNTVNTGASTSNKLFEAVKKIAGEYVGIKGIKKLVEMSDSLVTAKARLDVMNDGLQTTDELYQMIYGASQRARGSLNGMVDVVARFGNNAGNAFSNNAEVIAFSELVQKQMTIAGASTQESANTILQLSQALGSGVLRGDELNSIFEKAPNLIQGIADYLGVPIEKIRSMASEGKLTADVVKASVFASADKINERFDKMPKTWEQMWQSMQNQAIVALKPLLEKTNEIFNDERFQAGLSSIMEAFAVVGSVALDVLNLIAGAAAWVADNWSIIGPIVMTAAVAMGIYAGVMVAMKAVTLLVEVAQKRFNSSLLACPIFWVIAGFIAFVGIMGVFTKCVNDAYGLSLSFGGMLGGSLMVILAALGNMVIMIYNIVVECVIIIWNIIADLVNFIGNVFQNPLRAIVQLFTGVFDSVLGIIEAAAGAIGKLFGQDWSSGIAGFRQEMKDAVDKTYGKNEEYAKKLDLHAWDLSYIDYNQAFDAGYYLGDKAGKTFDYNNDINNALNNFDYDSMMSNIGDISDNTDSIKDSLEVTEEDLKYLRDIAEQEVVNRFTTAEIHIEQTNNNSVSREMDLDGIVIGLVDAVNEAVDEITEGVHA